MPFAPDQRSRTTTSNAQAGGETEADLRKRPMDEVILKRQAEPREIAYAILFLACNESSYITGQALMVDGGYSAI